MERVGLELVEVGLQALGIEDEELFLGYWYRHLKHVHEEVKSVTIWRTLGNSHRLLLLLFLKNMINH